MRRQLLINVWHRLPFVFDVRLLLYLRSTLPIEVVSLLVLCIFCICYLFFFKFLEKKRFLIFFRGGGGMNVHTVQYGNGTQKGRGRERGRESSEGRTIATSIRDQRGVFQAHTNLQGCKGARRGEKQEAEKSREIAKREEKTSTFFERVLRTCFIVTIHYDFTMLLECS